jgi:hypothetical protein
MKVVLHFVNIYANQSRTESGTIKVGFDSYIWCCVTKCLAYSKPDPYRTIRFTVVNASLLQFHH